MNYAKNKKLWADYGENLIYSQKKCPNVSFGFGTMSKNGCAATCVYNVLLMENRYTPMPEIIKKFDLYGEVFFGFLGTDPFAFISIFQSYGFKVNTYLNSNEFNDYAKKSKYAIVMTVSTSGGHFQLMTNYNEQDDSYTCYVPYYKQTMQGLFKEKSCKNSFIKILYTIN